MRISLGLVAASVLVFFGAGCVEINTTISVPSAATSTHVTSTGVAPTKKAPLPIFQTEKYHPKGATDVSIIPVDFRGDGDPEIALFYTSEDWIGGAGTRRNRHLDIYERRDDGWVWIKKDIGAETNVAVEKAFYPDPQVTDFGADGQQELVVFTCFGSRACDQHYYVFRWNGKIYWEAEIAKGYLNDKKYLRAGDTFIFTSGVTVRPEGILETYDVYCNEKEWSGVSFRSDEAICRRFQLFQRYQTSGWKTEFTDLGEVK